jgi:hypothetical protein
MSYKLLISLLALILLLPQASFSLYSQPPAKNTSAHNLLIAQSLNDRFDPDHSVNGTIEMTFHGTDINWAPVYRSFNFSLIRASVKLISIEPSIDNVISGENPFLIFSWGNESDVLEPKDWEKVPGLMGDDCVEFQVNSSVSRHALVTFTYGNLSQTANTYDNVVDVPQSILLAMQNTSGSDTLNITIDAVFNFTYTIDDRIPTHEGCRTNLVNFSSLIHVYDEMNHTSSGNKTLFFLRKPVLNEQWFRNNHFDTIVFSNSKLYRAQIRENGKSVKNISLYSFNVTTDKHGLQRIVSIPNNKIAVNSLEHKALNFPTPISFDNSSFIYLYEFNHSYEGIGENLLELEVTSFFGSSSAYSQKILSRSLTHSGNISEPGVDYNQSTARASRAATDSDLQPVILSFGIIGVLILLLLTKRMIK